MKKHTVLKVSVNLFKIMYIKRCKYYRVATKKRELIIHTMNSSLKMTKKYMAKCDNSDCYWPLIEKSPPEFCGI